MDLKQTSDALANVLPKNASFTIELCQRYASETDSIESVSCIGIKLVHDGKVVYQESEIGRDKRELKLVYATAVSQFKKWYANTCGFCWGTERSNGEPCPVCSVGTINFDSLAPKASSLTVK